MTDSAKICSLHHAIVMNNIQKVGCSLTETNCLLMKNLALVQAIIGLMSGNRRGGNQHLECFQTYIAAIYS